MARRTRKILPAKTEDDDEGVGDFPYRHPPGKRGDRPLSPKRLRFVEEYLVDSNATQAAIRAGYAPANAKQQGSQLLDDPRLAQALSEAQARKSKRLDITIDDIVRGLRKFAEDGTISEKDRIKSYELLGKNLGMFNTIKIQGDAEKPLQITSIVRNILPPGASVSKTDEISVEETGG